MPLAPTTARARAAELYRGGADLPATAAALGVSVKHARKLLRAAGVRLRVADPEARRLDRRATVARLYADGMSAKAIGALVGMKRQGVLAMLRSSGVRVRSKWTAPAVPRPPLDPAEVARRVAAGETLKDVAAALGYSARTVGRALDRHAPGVRAQAEERARRERAERAAGWAAERAAAAAARREAEDRRAATERDRAARREPRAARVAPPKPPPAPVPAPSREDVMLAARHEAGDAVAVLAARYGKTPAAVRDALAPVARHRRSVDRAGRGRGPEPAAHPCG